MEAVVAYFEGPHYSRGESDENDKESGSWLQVDLRVRSSVTAGGHTTHTLYLLLMLLITPALARPDGTTALCELRADTAQSRRDEASPTRADRVRATLQCSEHNLTQHSASIQPSEKSMISFTFLQYALNTGGGAHPEHLTGSSCLQRHRQKVTLPHTGAGPDYELGTVPTNLPRAHEEVLDPINLFFFGAQFLQFNHCSL
jgi:hypothetical protein